MGENSTISWTDHTFNPWIGCTNVGPGCDHCYAETLMDTRHGRVHWGSGQQRSRTKTWDEPRRWNRKAAKTGYCPRVFCASLADVFDNEVEPSWRDDLWQLIRETPLLRWQLMV
jgi:protein gp37